MIEFDENAFEIRDMYDILTEQYEQKRDETDDWAYWDEDEEGCTPEEYREQLFGDLKRGEEYILTEYYGDAEEVTVPDGVTGIKAYAFSGKTRLRAVYFPDTDLRIANGAFMGCTSLQTVRLSKNLTKTGQAAFANCTALKDIEFPNNVVAMGERAFAGCTALEHVRLSENLRAVSAEMFKDCTALKSIYIPDSVEILSINCFENCTALENIRLGANVRGIGWDAFRGCKSLRHIRLPELLDEINTNLFYGSGLEEIYITKNIGLIFDSAFSYCHNLVKVEVDPENSSYRSHDNCIFDNSSNAVVYGGNNGALPDDGSLTTIGNNAFTGNLRVTELNLPYGLKHIKIAAFRDCENLRYVAFPNTLVEIGYCAFARCVSLEEVTVPGSVRVIDACAFSGSGLRRAVLKRGVEEIEASAFADCMNLRELYIPVSVKEIGINLLGEINKSVNVYIESGGEANYEKYKSYLHNANVILGCDPSIFD